MAKPELRLVKWGRCPSCGVPAFLWATSTRARIKRCRRCAHASGATVGHQVKTKWEPHEHTERT